MSTLIIYMSYHKMNTEKVAKTMAEAMNAMVAKVEDVKPEDLAAYDLIGFGSGIYGGKYHKDLFDLIDKLPKTDKKAFVFSTSGGLNEQSSKPIKEKLMDKGFRIVDEFNCPGAVGVGFLVMKNKGHPDEKDLENARAFAKKLVQG